MSLRDQVKRECDRVTESIQARLSILRIENDCFDEIVSGLSDQVATLEERVEALEELASAPALLIEVEAVRG